MGLIILMKFIAIGGGDEIGASCFFLKIGKFNLILDSGMRFKGLRNYPKFHLIKKEIKNWFEIDFVCISHSHMDHIGSLPALSQNIGKKPIYMTKPSYDLMEILIRDATKIQILKQSDEEIGDYPRIIAEELYNDFIQKSNINLVNFSEEINFHKDDEYLSLIFFPAGHILGASMIYLNWENSQNSKKILYTGDFSVTPMETVGNFKLPFNLDIDILITETTYANNPTVKNRKDEVKDLVYGIYEIIEKKGTVLIPSFALGRAQDLLIILSNLIPTSQIFVDGLTKSIIPIYEKFSKFGPYNFTDNFYNNNVNPVPVKLDEISLIKRYPRSVIISSSGMLANGSKSFKYAQNLISDQKNGIFFTGYLDEESPGDQLLKIDKKMKFYETTIEANINKFYLSAHPNNKELKDFINSINPKEAIIPVHGYESYNFFQKSNFKDKYHILYSKNNQFIEMT